MLDTPCIEPAIPTGMLADTTPAPAPQPVRQAAWLASALDEVDYGILVLLEQARVVHANRAARRELAEGHPLLLRGPHLGARAPSDAVLLADLLACVEHRRLRRFAMFGAGEWRISASFVPLEGSDTTAGPTLVLLGKRQLCETLTVEAYARAHGLTPAETRVLITLCRGETPCRAAVLLGVALSTVRTQIGNIRAKTGTTSIRSLVRDISILPPLMNVLTGAGCRDRFQLEWN